MDVSIGYRVVDGVGLGCDLAVHLTSVLYRGNKKGAIVGQRERDDGNGKIEYKM